MDDRIRELQRQAATGDPEARFRLWREQHRADLCLCCSNNHKIPMLPVAAHNVVFTINQIDRTVNDYDEASTASIDLRLIGKEYSVWVALEWLKKLAPSCFDFSTGVMTFKDMGTLYR